MRRSDRPVLAGFSATALLLLAACGTQRAPSLPADPMPSSSATEGYCPQVAGVVAPSPCISAGAEQNQQANQTFNSRIPLPAPAAAEAATVARRIQESLERLSPAQRLQVPAVQSALLAGGLLRTDLVILKGSSATSVAFGGYERLSTRPSACAWGTVSVKAVEVDSGGITREGACLPSAGGH